MEFVGEVLGRDFPAARLICKFAFLELRIGQRPGRAFRRYCKGHRIGCSTAGKLLDASPLLAKERAVRGATRQAFKQHFFDGILATENSRVPPKIGSGVGETPSV
jgi:hypothetical protein